MDDVEDDTSAFAGPEYSYRPSLLGAPWQFRLTPTYLAWEVGRRSGRVRYDRIGQMRISFRVATMQGNRYLTEVWPANGDPKLMIASTSWKSMVEQVRQDAPYSAFVTELHRRIAEVKTDAQFLAGAAPYLYWPGLIVFALVAAGLAALTVRALQAQSFAGAAFIAGFFLLFLWQLGGYYCRNRPGFYRPDAVPRELLP
jgi:hypothetical protein